MILKKEVGRVIIFPNTLNKAFLIVSMHVCVLSIAFRRTIIINVIIITQISERILNWEVSNI